MGWRPGLTQWAYLYSLPEIYLHFIEMEELFQSKDTHWFYFNRDNDPIGPVNQLEMEALLGSKQISPNTLVWKIGDHPKRMLILQ